MEQSFGPLQASTYKRYDFVNEHCGLRHALRKERKRVEDFVSSCSNHLLSLPDDSVAQSALSRLKMERKKLLETLMVDPKDSLAIEPIDLESLILASEIS